MSALWEPITLGEHFLRGAEQYGDRIALSDGAQKVTYRQLVELAGTDRERLRQAGVQPHELVIMQMSNGIPFVQMFLALMLGIVKLHQVDGVSKFLIATMGILFVAPGVSILEVWETVAPSILWVVVISLVSTAVVFAVSALVTQAMIRKGKKQDD